MSRSARPCIGITTDYVWEGRQAAGRSNGPHTAYFDSVQAAGGTPLFIPPLKHDADGDALLDRIDGVILGSRHRECATGRPRQPSLGGRLDLSTDHIIIRKVIERQAPVLGIADGMLQLNLACGGSLFPQLGDEHPRGLPHQGPNGEVSRHAVFLERWSRLERIYGGSEIMVSSRHHQAVRQVGTGLRIAALAPDGVIEGIEAVDANWFCIGIQWQPELETTSSFDQQLYAALIQAASPRRAASLAG